MTHSTFIETNQSLSSLSFDPLSVSDALLEKYNTTGPRYTSYPTAPVWTDDYTFSDHLDSLKENADESGDSTPLSLYAHLPFCESRCLFCGCNVVISKQKEKAETYLDYLFREIERTANQINLKRPVIQSHWGGGTPTYLSSEQLQRLFKFKQEIFNFKDDAEISIEVDPRATTRDQIDTLKELGFNRISLGVQDFEEDVQKAVRRIQPMKMTEEFTEYCRHKGFTSINYDLIYGLPHQTVTTFKRTLEAVIHLSPDRIALYNFAYIPWVNPIQKLLPEEAMPNGKTKFAIFKQAIQMLTNAGYVYIGMDHFAKPTDELTLALQNGTLHRNFMGYTVKNRSLQEDEADLLGFGVSAISSLKHAYAQNIKTISDYYDALKDKRLPVHRGYRLTQDDQIRKALILAILCQGRVDFTAFSEQFNIDFESYFSPALKQLHDAEHDGLLEWTRDGFQLTPLGRVFGRNIAMPFDAYLEEQRRQQAEKSHPTFSKTL